MKRICLSLLSYCLVLISIHGQTSHAINEIIVKFNDETKVEFDRRQNQVAFELPVVDKLNNDLGIKSITPLSSSNALPRSFVLKFGRNHNIAQVIQAYLKTDLFEYVEPNFIGVGAGQSCEEDLIPGDSHFNRQYGLHNTGVFALSVAKVDADIDMDQAWEIEQGDPSIIVAVLDAGTRLSHPEFTSRIWTNTAEIENNIDSDNNGYIDDILGWDFVNDDNDPTDDHGHGTNVAGIVVSNGDNGLGYAGVDWNCKLMSCKILDSNNNGRYSWWIAAIYYAVDQGVDVINMSVGGNSYSAAMGDALTYAHDQNVVVVASMMNFNNSVPYYPAAYEHTIAVGSTDADDTRTDPFFWSATSGSNYGPHIDVVAPGNYIYGLSYQSNANYNTYWGGTSQATPLVTGIASLLLAQDPSRTPDQIRSIIHNTAEDETGDLIEDTPGFDDYYGHGRVNAYDALMQLPSATENELRNTASISIFPNPASQTFTMVSDVSVFKITIYNTLGKLVHIYTFDKNQKKETIDVTHLTNGLYSLHFYNENNKMILSDKLVVD